MHDASIQTLRRAITDELSWARREIEYLRKSRIKVQNSEPSGTGNLIKTHYNAVENIDFKVDLANESHRPSAEIEALYFCSTGSWNLTQGQEECPSTDSDIVGFDPKAFPPATRSSASGESMGSNKASRHEGLGLGLQG